MPAFTAYGLELLVELAIGRAADAAEWGVSQWRESRWGTSDVDAGDWIDVTCDVLDGLRMTAGSNTDDGVTRRWESASAGFTLDGPQWDPWNGPHVGILGDRTPVRISWRAPSLIIMELLDRFGVAATSYDVAGWVPAFTGYIATRGYSWDPAAQEADVECVDGTSVLVATDRVAAAAQGAAETAAARVARIASTALWTAGTDIVAGGTALQATMLQGEAWDELLDVADTDLALLWVNRAGQLAYRPRGRVGQGVRLQGRLVVCEGTVPVVGPVERTNLLHNPRAGAATLWFQSLGGGTATLTQITAGIGPLPGVATCYRRTITAPATVGSAAGIYTRDSSGPMVGAAGDVLTGSIYVRASVDTRCQVTITPRLAGATSGSNVRGPFVACPANTWVRLTATLPTTAAYDDVQVWAQEDTVTLLPAGATVDATCAMVELTTQGEYFDGSIPDTATTDYAWTGTVDASSSTLAPITQEPATDDVAVMTMERNQPSATRNRVSIARRVDPTVAGDAPVVVQLDDRESIARFQAHAYTRTDLLHIDDVWSTTLAQAVLGGGAWPSPAPGQVVLDSISGDELVAPLLLTLEPDMTFDVVDDGGSVWREAVVGWDVQVSNDEIEGVLLLEDVTRWTDVGHWGADLWGVDRWGIGGI